MKLERIELNLKKNSYFFCLLIQAFYFIPAIINIFKDCGNVESYILNMFNAPAFHWLMITSYLYWLYKNDTIIFHALYRIKFNSNKYFYLHRMIKLLKHTSLLIAPFWIIAISMLIISSNQIIFSMLIVELVNLSLGILLIGTTIQALNCLRHPRLWNYIAISILLSLDYLCSTGMLRFDMNIIYYQMLSIQFYLAGNENIFEFLLISATLFFKILILFLATFLLLKYRSYNKVSLSLLDMPYFKRVFFAIPIGLLLGASYGTSVSSISEFLIAVFGGPVSIEYDPISIIVFSLPFYIYLYMFIDIINFNENGAYVYIFTRGINKLKWLVSKSITLLSCSIFYYLLLFCSSLIVPLLLHVPLGPDKLFFETLKALLFIHIIGSTMILFTANMICLKTKKTLVFFFILCFVLIGQFLYILIPKPFSNYIIYILPTTQFMITLHDIPILRLQWQDYFPRYAPGFSIWYSLIYSSLVIVVNLILYQYRMKKMDLLF